jgi:hypothetical protein
MLLRIFFFVLLCGTRTQKFSAPFRYTLAHQLRYIGSLLDSAISLGKYQPSMLSNIVLCVRSFLTNNDGFRIGRLDLLTPSFAVILNYDHLQQLTIYDCLRLAPFLTDYDCLLSSLSSTVTELVLIYESVTSSASVFRWFTLHS